MNKISQTGCGCLIMLIVGTVIFSFLYSAFEEPIRSLVAREPEDVNAAYKTEVYAPFDEIKVLFDFAEVSLDLTNETLKNGKITNYEAYNEYRKIQSTLENVNDRIDEIKAPGWMPREDRKLVNETKESYDDAHTDFYISMNRLTEAVDKNELSPSTVNDLNLYLDQYKKNKNLAHEKFNALNNKYGAVVE